MKGESKKGSTRVEWNPDEVLKVDEVALLLRMKPNAIYNGIKNGVIPALKIGNRFRLSKRAILESLNVKK
jgi:excisionase family DNA binding protein